MDREILGEISGIDEPVALVSVVDVKGSAPRHPGSAMIVYASGRISGTVGGGKGEAWAIEAGLRAIRTGSSTFIEVQMLGDDPTDKDLICGGVNRMLVESITGREAYRKAAAMVAGGARVVLVRRYGNEGADSVGVAVVSEEEAGEKARAAISSGEAAFDAATGTFLDPVAPEEKLVILGGGHVGLAIARAAKWLGFAITVIDDRPEFASGGRFEPDVKTVAGSYTDIVASLPFDRATYAIIVSRGHLFDLECARAVLKRPFRYAGLIGSKRKIALIREQLRQDGYAPATIESLCAPVGIDIGAETPEEIAVSILAQMIMYRHGVQASAGAVASAMPR